MLATSCWPKTDVRKGNTHLAAKWWSSHTSHEACGNISTGRDDRETTKIPNSADFLLKLPWSSDFRPPRRQGEESSAQHRRTHCCPRSQRPGTRILIIPISNAATPITRLDLTKTLIPKQPHPFWYTAENHKVKKRFPSSKNWCVWVCAEWVRPSTRCPSFSASTSTVCMY